MALVLLVAVRMHVPVGISYDADLKLAQKLKIEAATSSCRVLPDPKPNAWLTAFDESSMDDDVLVWFADPEGGVGNIRSAVLDRLWELFKGHGVGVPFPQQHVHIRSLPAEEASNAVR